MNRGSTPISDKVTVLVFKDNYAARTFQIPLSWISRFGILAGTFSLIAAFSVIAAIKYYRIAAKTDPIRVQDLEQELNEVKTHLKRLETKDTQLIGATTSAPNPVVSNVIPPQATQSVTTPVSEQTDSTNATNSSNLFLAFPANLQGSLPDPASLPFSLQSAKANWKGKTLKVYFAIQYIQTDQGSQQGRILVLARGPNQLLAYPTNVFNPSGTDSLINPEKGEPFSVSRFREVKAEFGPLPSTSALQNVEILIFNRENRLLAYKKLNIESAKSSSRSSSQKTESEQSDEYEATSETSPSSSEGSTSQ